MFRFLFFFLFKDWFLWLSNVMIGGIVLVWLLLSNVLIFFVFFMFKFVCVIKNFLFLFSVICV